MSDLPFVEGVLLQIYFKRYRKTKISLIRMNNKLDAGDSL